MSHSLFKTLLGVVIGVAIAFSAHTVRAEYNPKILRIGFQKSASLLTLVKS